MRAFFEAVEAGLPLVRHAEIAAALDPEHYAALRRAGILRLEPGSEHEELSIGDLVRALRVLYGVEARGLSTPGMFVHLPLLLGWAREADGDREVFLLHYPVASLLVQTFRTRKTLLLLPTARILTPNLRAKHPPSSFIGIEVLEETLAIRDGRLARAHARAPSAPDLSSFAPVPPPAPAPPPTLAPAPAPAPLPIRGASRWNEIHISLIDPTTVRIDLPGASLRRTHVDLGMAHPRNRQPTRVWELLVELCDGHGIFHGRRFGSADATKKLVSRLGRQLKAIFGLSAPAFHPYRPKAGWQARFRASPRLARDG